MRSQERSDVLAEILLYDRGHLRVEHDLQPASTDVPSHGALTVGVEVAARVKDAGPGAGRFAPTATTAAEPSPNSPLATRLATEWSSRCTVSEQSSTETRAPTWFG